tara:strand:+ start:1971 stop:2132 length:162 start_codon:yes stop_codon:yes gene_type:complete
MKIKIETTVNIDVESWCLNYGTEPGDVRDDVKGYVEHIIQSQLESVDVLKPSD